METLKTFIVVAIAAIVMMCMTAADVMADKCHKSTESKDLFVNALTGDLISDFKDDFILIRKCDFDDLAREINILRSLGWKLAGNTELLTSNKNSYLWTQPMTRINEIVEVVQ